MSSVNPSTIHVLVADDEPLALARMIRLLEDIPAVEVVGQAADGEELLARFEEKKPQVVVMDIRMPVLSGLDTADILRQKNRDVFIVFASAYDEHALEAFDLDACDYLTKPIRPSRLRATFDRIAHRMKGAPLENKPELIAIPRVEGVVFQPRNKLIMARVTAGSLELVCCDQTFYTTWTLKELEAKLGSDGRFFKVSRQCLIHLDYLEGMLPAASGASILQLKNGVRCEASRTATKHLKDILNV